MINHSNPFQQHPTYFSSHIEMQIGDREGGKGGELLQTGGAIKSFTAVLLYGDLSRCPVIAKQKGVSTQQ